MTTTIPKSEHLEKPEKRLWTREEYERFVRMGAFAPEDKLELIEGEIVNKMASMYTPHATGIVLTSGALRRAFVAGCHLRIQMPISVGDFSQPEPDIAVVAGDERTYEEAHPTTALLAVEVADTSLRFDRATKAALYARAGIREYWILNLNDRLLEVFRQPRALSGNPLGYGYARASVYDETQPLSPEAVPDAVIAVADLLPSRRNADADTGE